MVEASKRSLVDVVVLLCDFVELHKADFTDEELLVYESKKALMAAPSIALKSSGSLSPGSATCFIASAISHSDHPL
jgi:hypothetical protein